MEGEGASDSIEPQVFVFEQAMWTYPYFQSDASVIDSFENKLEHFHWWESAKTQIL